MDTVATATLNVFGAHVATWNCTDHNEAWVPDGDYTFHMEMAGSFRTVDETSSSFTITIAPGAHTISVPNMGSFVNITVNYQ